MHESFYFLLLPIQKRGAKLNFLPLYFFTYQITKKINSCYFTFQKPLNW